MNECYWYPRDPQRFLTDTQWCDAATEVAHNRLTDMYYALGRPIKDDQERIMNIGKIKPADYMRVRGNLQELGWKYENGELHHRKIEETLAGMEANRLSQIARTKAATEARQVKRDVERDEQRDVERSVDLTTTTTTDTDTETEKREVAPLAEVFEFWNANVKTKCLVMSDKRRRALDSRWKDKFFKNNWKTAVQKIAASDFCNGNSERGWKATFDWLLQPDTVAKVMEGKYDNRYQSKPKPTHIPDATMRVIP